MTCNVSIEYPYQLNTIDFRSKVAEPMAKCGAWQIVHEFAYTTVDGQDHGDLNPFYYKLDHECAVSQDGPERRAALLPIAKNVLMKAIADRLKEYFTRLIVDYVCPFSQAEKYEGIPGDVMYNTPVKLRSISDKNERLTFVFSADLNFVDRDQDICQNVKVGISYVKVPETDG